MNEDLTDLLAEAKEYETRLPELKEWEEQRVDRPLASRIDHTLLKPEATPAQVEKLCDEARSYVFASVCVNPIFVPLAARLLEGSPVLVCTVIGFPLGATLTGAKVAETNLAIDAGAREIDMVIPVGLLKGGEYAAV